MNFQEMAEAQESEGSPLSTPPLEKPPDEARGKDKHIYIFKYIPIHI